MRLTLKEKIMLAMVDKIQILLKYYREGKSQRSISRDLQVSRHTVKKYILEHELEIKSKNVKKHLEKCLSFKPQYKTGTRAKQKLSDEILTEIESCLAKNREN